MAGGNAGSAIAQAIFFTPAVLAVYDAFKWMGVMAVGIAAFQIFLWFPMWGGVIFPAKKGYTEQDYYYAGDSEGLGPYASCRHKVFPNHAMHACFMAWLHCLWQAQQLMKCIPQDRI